MKEAFEELKQRFQEEVILQIPDLSKDCWITVQSGTYAFRVHWSRRMIAATSAQWRFFRKNFRAPGRNGLMGPTTKLAN